MAFVFIFVLGLAIGSFLNVLIDRLPNGESVVKGRSHCDFCKKTLRWYELIPLFSWIIQKGTCRRCRKRLSLQYPLIELVTALGFVLLYRVFASSPISLFAYFIIFSSLLVIFVADFKYQIIPDSMVVLGTFGALLRMMGPIRQVGLMGVLPYMLSAVGAAGFFLLLWLVTKHRGMGFGDVKLVFLLGLLLGFPAIIVALYTAFLTGAIAGVILILLGKKSLKGSVAFGPFLIIGFFVGAQWTDIILNFWRNLF